MILAAQHFEVWLYRAILMFIYGFLISIYTCFFMLIKFRFKSAKNSMNANEIAFLTKSKKKNIEMFHS